MGKELRKMLGNEGLTATSANHIANIAKEMYESLETKMQSIRLTSRDYTLAVNGQTYRVENESSKDEFNSLSASLKEVAALKSLIAWLREGIKAKEQLCSADAENEWVKEQIEADRTELKEPEGIKPISFSDILTDEPIDRQSRYYTLEAKCATLGKFIHPDGHFSAARKAFYDKQKNPTSINGLGQNAEISKYSSNFTSEEIDAEFFKLQQEYRSVQAEFNALKAELETKLTEAKRKAFKDASEARKTWRLTRDAALLERSAQIKPLKIMIPEPLKDIYGKVAAVASAK